MPTQRHSLLLQQHVVCLHKRHSLFSAKRFLPTQKHSLFFQQHASCLHKGTHSYLTSAACAFNPSPLISQVSTLSQTSVRNCLSVSAATDSWLPPTNADSWGELVVRDSYLQRVQDHTHRCVRAHYARSLAVAVQCHVMKLWLRVVGWTSVRCLHQN